MTAPDLRTRPRSAPLYEALASPPMRGLANLFWLGQAGFALRTAAALLFIDPYLSNSLAEKYRDAHYKHKRMMPPPIAPDEVRGVDLLLATHAHSDHLDPGGMGQIMALNPECQLVCPAPVVPKALERGADRDRVIGMHMLEKRRFGTVTLELLPAAHEELALDENGDPVCGGFIIETEGWRMYHSGDCVPFPGQADMLRERTVDIALLPVNGRDAERTARGVIGNFHPEEAAELCLAAGIGVLVPHHFGMFDFNTIDPGELAKTLGKYSSRGLRWFIPDITEVFSIGKGE